MAESQPVHYDVFLSHNSRDKSVVELLAVMLRNKRLNPFLDKWNLVPGEPIEDALLEALEHSNSAVIFIGPCGEGPWQSEEMRDILKRAVRSHNEFRAIPVLLPGASTEALEKTFLSSRLWIEFSHVDDDDALLRLTKAIQGESYGDESVKLPDSPAPYRGLERFERIERPREDFFFGRDDEIRVLVDRLVRERFVAVIGASGSGKSSLIRAGLSKQLAEDLHPGIRRWQTITVEPGSRPFRSLAVQVAVAAGIPVADREAWIERTEEKWTATPDGIRLTIEAIFADAGQQLLVFIDQFEELFTHRREGVQHEQIARQFVAGLTDIWKNGGDRIRVVVAIRADFVERCLEIGALRELLQDRTMLVGEVGDDALREIVKSPAARVGAFLEKGLMERILTEVRDQSGSLPLLQQALHELWKHRRGAWLTHEAYNASGGVAGALNDQAQNAYNSLNEDQRKIADGLFPRLITLGEGVPDTRRRVKRKELYPQGADPAAVNAVIDVLSGKVARILVTTREGTTADNLGSGEDFVEFTHEALLGNWKYLSGLLDRERESIRKHRNLTTAAEEWQSQPQGERNKFLLRGGRLIIAEQWATERGGEMRMNATERMFLQASTQERVAEEAHKTRVARRLKWLSAVATVAALIAIGLGGLFYTEQQNAATERDEALRLQSLFLADAAQQQLSRGDAVTAALLGLAGLQDPTAVDVRQRNRPYVPEAWSSLHSARCALREKAVLSGHTDHVTCAVFSPDGSRIATASADQTVRLWDATTLSVVHTLEGHQDGVWTVAFSSDGAFIVTASQDRTARIWNVDTGELVRVLEGHIGELNTAVFNRDGTQIVTSSADGTARVWDAAAGESLREFKHSDVVYSANFSPDGAHIVTSCSDHFAWIWEVDTGQQKVRLSGHSDEVFFAAFSPDGTRIVTASRDKTAMIWDAVTYMALHTLKGHTEEIFGVVYNSVGDRIVSASQDGTARIWEAESGQLIRILSGHLAGLNTAAFSNDGELGITAADDRTARIWNVNVVDSLIGHRDVVWSACFHPEEDCVLTASQDGTAGFWDTTTATQKHAFVHPQKSPLNAAAFSPDGKLIVTASADRTAQIWDVATQVKLHTLAGHDDWVYSAEFSFDGTRVVTAGDKTLRIWDVAGGKQIRVLKGHADWVYDAEFSPDGKLAVSGSEDRTARIWNVATGQQIRSLTGHTGTVTSVAFSPDGAYVITASNDRTARVWKTATGQEIRRLTGHKGKFLSARFSPDGKYIVTASQDRTARVWNADTGETVRVFQGHTGEVNSAAFSRDGTRIVTASADGTARIWDVEMTERQQLINETRKLVPRCLTPVQRNQFFLPSEPPAWAVEMGKWPYHTDEWKKWLADRNAGKETTMPDLYGASR